FCREAEPVVRIWEKFERSCTVLKEMPWGTARIGFGLRARSNGLFEPTVGFVDSYPDVSFSMITDMHENFPDAVASGRLDVAIERVYDSQLSGLIDRVAMFPLLWEPQCILMSRTDPLCREASLPIRVLDGKTAVCGPVDSGDDWEMKQLCARDGVRLSRVLRADDINAVMALVQRGKGYALGPVSFAEYFGVAAVPLEPKMEVALYLVCRKEERNSALIRRLQKHLKESLLQHLAAD
ncbi:MAG: substrate-binding domain-containing protein, partial [Oscillospiraceae bacterium]|nr:substrate-binding domain-containing protein [Oscillospiraceae bacterium]